MDGPQDPPRCCAPPLVEAPSTRDGRSDGAPREERGGPRDVAGRTGCRGDPGCRTGSRADRDEDEAPEERPSGDQDSGAERLDGPEGGSDACDSRVATAQDRATRPGVEASDRVRRPFPQLACTPPQIDGREDRADADPLRGQGPAPDRGSKRTVRCGGGTADGGLGGRPCAGGPLAPLRDELSCPTVRAGPGGPELRSQRSGGRVHQPPQVMGEPGRGGPNGAGGCARGSRRLVRRRSDPTRRGRRSTASGVRARSEGGADPYHEGPSCCTDRAFATSRCWPGTARGRREHGPRRHRYRGRDGDHRLRGRNRRRSGHGRRLTPGRRSRQGRGS